MYMHEDMHRATGKTLAHTHTHIITACGQACCKSRLSTVARPWVSVRTPGRRMNVSCSCPFCYRALFIFHLVMFALHDLHADMDRPHHKYLWRKPTCTLSTSPLNTIYNPAFVNSAGQFFTLFFTNRSSCCRLFTYMYIHNGCTQPFQFQKYCNEF